MRKFQISNAMKKKRILVEASLYQGHIEDTVTQKSYPWYIAKSLIAVNLSQMRGKQ